MSDTPKNPFLFEFGINEKRALGLMSRVTKIIAENLKIANEPGSDMLQCDLDKSACVRDIVQYIEREDLSTVDAQWMFFAFGLTIGNNGRLRVIAWEEYTARRLYEALTTTTPQEV